MLPCGPKTNNLREYPCLPSWLSPAKNSILRRLLPQKFVNTGGAEWQTQGGVEWMSGEIKHQFQTAFATTEKFCLHKLESCQLASSHPLKCHPTQSGVTCASKNGHFSGIKSPHEENFRHSMLTIMVNVSPPPWTIMNTIKHCPTMRVSKSAVSPRTKTRITRSAFSETRSVGRIPSGLVPARLSAQ